MTKLLSRFSHVTTVMLTAGTYALVGKLGLSLAFLNASATAVWPPSGFALAAILLLGNRIWPGIFLGAFAVNLGTTGDFLSSFGIALGNSLEPILGAFLVRRFAGGLRTFDRAPEIFKFIFLAAIVSTTVSATIGVSSLSLSGLAGRNEINAIWLTWWLGDLVSNLIVAPLLVLWATRPTLAFTAKRIKAAVILLLPVVLVGEIVFGHWPQGNLRSAPLIFLQLPLFLWVGFQFGQRGAVTAAFVTCVIAICETLRGNGPFANGDPNTSLIFLQLFMGILTVTALAMSAMVRERRQTEKNRAELLSLAQKLNAATSPQRAGEIIMDAAANIFGWDACFIHLCSESKEFHYPIINIDTIDGKKIAVPSVYGGVKPSNFLCDVIEHGAKLLLRKPPFEFRKDAVAFGDTNRPSVSLMFVPIRDGQRVVGILSVQSYALDAYNKDHLIALQSLADYCGGALERIRANEELRLAKEQLKRHADDLEKRVAERTAELNETVGSLESFCYTIAHDLRAPLRSVQGFSRFLLEDYSEKLDATGQDYCRRISTSACNMDNLISDLLSYGQLAHKELPLEPVDLEDLVDDVLSQFTDEIRAKNGGIKIKRPLAIVLGNSTVIEQAVDNLISNALKFVTPQTPPCLVILTEEWDGKIRLWIQDNGIGVAPEYHERIFQVFERLHDTAVYPGTGVGLAIVRKGIERIGGRTGIESQVGQGSRFWIELPKAG